MFRFICNFMLGATLAAGAAGAQAQAPTEIKVSYQPALYWSLPIDSSL